MAEVQQMRAEIYFIILIVHLLNPSIPILLIGFKSNFLQIEMHSYSTRAIQYGDHPCETGTKEFNPLMHGDGFMIGRLWHHRFRPLFFSSLALAII